VILTLINIGSSEAFTIILSLGNCSLISSYAIIIICALIHRLRGKELPKAEFNLGKWGIWVNLGALTFLLPVFVFSFFPPLPNPSTATMNWAIVMFGGVLILATVYYIAWAKNSYQAPDISVQETAVVELAEVLEDGFAFVKKPATEYQTETA
jgi:amino acid transporter